MTDWTTTTGCPHCTETDAWADVHRSWHALVAALPWWGPAHRTVDWLNRRLAA